MPDSAPVPPTARRSGARHLAGVGAAVLAGLLGAAPALAASAAPAEPKPPAAAAAAARAPQPAAAGPAADAQASRVAAATAPPKIDPLERLRLRLAERLAAVKPVEAETPYDLQVSTRAEAASAPPARPPAKRKPAAAATSQRVGSPHWGYEGEAGPHSWGGLCAKGQRQSPIDIRDGLAVKLEPVAFDYRAGAFSVVDTGHTVQVNVAPGNFAEFGGRRYELQQFHFHRPSEERLDGRQFELSVHLVHKDVEGRLAVVALLLGKGAAQPALDTVFGNLPLEKHEENRARVTLDPALLLPAERAYFTYMGSLTTPPCSEGVQWVVLRHPMAASAEQIELFSRLYPNNARPLQSASGRRILQSP
jgi:carbonic anhydrase